MEDPPLKKIRQNSGDDEDRLSSLPDCVLCYILSFLETKYVIQTSVLSKRFQNLWPSLPSLYFHCNSFRLLKKFDKFVNRVLTLRETSGRVENFKCETSGRVENFEFHRMGSIGTYLLNRIIKYAMSHGVLRLHVEVKNEGSYSFPESGYSSESLRTFELSIPTELKKPLSFPRLTKLHLRYVSLMHSDLLSACPCLMELTLHNCSVRKLGILKIDSPILTKLTITKHGGNSECKVVVSAPKLASFCYSGDDGQLLSISSEPSALEVVSLEVELCRQLEKKGKEVQSNLIKLLQPFHNAKNITLSLDAIKVLSKFPDLLPKSSPFVNMKSLSIKAWRRECFFVIPSHVRTYLLGDPPRAQPTFHEKYPSWNNCTHMNCEPVWQSDKERGS